ncbi:hypothetical protein TNCV_437121 [Trichonephila clavipes]|nr:hypothetical protein TNCV_437121 [Trichonephila clavipes]
MSSGSACSVMIDPSVPGGIDENARNMLTFNIVIRTLHLVRCHCILHGHHVIGNSFSRHYIYHILKSMVVFYILEDVIFYQGNSSTCIFHQVLIHHDTEGIRLLICPETGQQPFFQPIPIMKYIIHWLEGRRNGLSVSLIQSYFDLIRNKKKVTKTALIHRAILIA